MILTTSKKSAFFISSYCNHGRGGHKWQSNLKNCVSTIFFIEGTKLYCPPSPPTYNKFVSTNLCKDRTFGKYPPFLNLRLIQGTFLLNCTNLLISQIFHQKIALPRAITNWKFWPSTFLLWGGVALQPAFSRTP